MKLKKHWGEMNAPLFFKREQKPLFIDEQVWLSSQYEKGLILVAITGGTPLDHDREYYFFDKNCK